MGAHVEGWTVSSPVQADRERGDGQGMYKHWAMKDCRRLGQTDDGEMGKQLKETEECWHEQPQIDGRCRRAQKKLTRDAEVT